MNSENEKCASEPLKNSTFQRGKYSRRLCLSPLEQRGTQTLLIVSEDERRAGGLIISIPVERGLSAIQIRRVYQRLKMHKNWVICLRRGERTSAGFICFCQMKGNTEVQRQEVGESRRSQGRFQNKKTVVGYLWNATHSVQEQNKSQKRQIMKCNHLSAS